MADTEIAIIPAAEMALAERPAFLPAHDNRGTEHITKDDIQMPRLGLAQALSPEVQEGDPKFIEGLKVGGFFNNLTKEVYGKGPIYFTVVRADVPRYIEFIPRTEGGGIRDFNVPATDPRTQFTMTADGKPVPPIATKFYDFIIMFTETKELAALSLKSTGLKAARQLNAFMKLRNAASFAGLYTLSSKMEKNSKGTYAVHVIANAGYVTEEVYNAAGAVYEAIRDKVITIDREPGEDDGEFPPVDVTPM